LAKESKSNLKAFYRYAQSKLKTRKKIGNLKDEEGHTLQSQETKQI